ncbi:START domain-containing protein [Idiomarina sp. A28L]|uniref:START domain-containing protein n=1 Tax=Idiomarina sp. A28L TaxID=1036674 RepID=UPI0002138D36|nr:START domain-containing protein [Idiomarina sp. A28L]EGN75487.1 START domain-containing protein [Idiomarina sp. A28L]
MKCLMALPLTVIFGLSVASAAATDTTTDIATGERERFANNSNVEIEYSYVDDDVLQIRARTELNGNSGGCIAAFMHLFEDTERVKDWIEIVTDAELIAQPNPYTRIVHTEFDSHWPISDRDMVTRSIWQYDAESRALHIEITNASEEKPPSKNVIRMTDVAASWHIQATENGTVKVDYQGNSNPKGNIPRTSARASAITAVEQTFAALQTSIADSEYQKDYYSVPCLE